MEQVKIQQFKYNEFEVLIDGGKIARKVPTLRESVMLYPHQAERNNNTMRQTKLYYELAEAKKQELQEGGDAKTLPNVDADKEKRKELFSVARNEMKLKFQNTITTEDLEKLIEENRK